MYKFPQFCVETTQCHIVAYFMLSRAQSMAQLLKHVIYLSWGEVHHMAHCVHHTCISDMCCMRTVHYANP